MTRDNLEFIDKILLESKYDIVDKSVLKDIILYHNAYEISFLIKSENQLFVKNTSYKALSHHLAFIAPHTIHFFIYTENTEYQRMVLNFEGDFISNVLQQCDCQGILSDLFFSAKQINANVINLDLQEFNRVNRLFNDLNQKYASNQLDKSRHQLGKLKLTLAMYLIEMHEMFGAERSNNNENMIKN